MKQSEVLALLHKVVAENQQYTTWTVSTPHLVILVNKAIEAEREACAKIVDEWANGMSSEPEMVEIAKEIRVRGEENA